MHPLLSTNILHVLLPLELDEFLSADCRKFISLAQLGLYDIKSAPPQWIKNMRRYMR